MKSIKIKFGNVNKEKKHILLRAFSDLEKMSEEYLKLKLQELETKEYKPFKQHYAYFREKHSLVNSGMLQYQLRNIDKMLKSYISWCKKRHKIVKYPENIKVAIPLRNDMFKFMTSNNSTEFNGWLKTLRTYFPLKVCDYHVKCLEKASKICDSEITRDDKGQLYLRLCFETVPETHKGNKSLGVDLGIAKPIVCSDGKQIGSGKYIKHKKIEFGKKRAKHQKNKQQISRKQSNWTNNLNHNLSKQLINHCISTGVNVLVLEKLKGGHLANRKYRKFTWAFRDLISKIKYKAESHGIKVISVHPAHTSQTCSGCGVKEKSNRKTQSLYECSSCGLRANADINASKNILNLSVQNGLNMNLASGKLQTGNSLVFSH